MREGEREKEEKIGENDMSHTVNIGGIGKANIPSAVP